MIKLPSYRRPIDPLLADDVQQRYASGDPKWAIAQDLAISPRKVQEIIALMGADAPPPLKKRNGNRGWTNGSLC